MTRFIFLIGYMGCGKSTLAPVLAQHLNCPWQDTDDEIAHRFGLTIPEIFNQHGESAFRAAEAKFLAQLMETALQDAPAELDPHLQPQLIDRVIATGGGFFTQAKDPAAALASAKKIGYCVYLKAPAPTLWQRVQASGQQAGLKTGQNAGKAIGITQRPLALDEQTFLSRFRTREPLYLQADLIIETPTFSAPDDMATCIINFCKQPKA
ncbi:MAG: shikimate kinase [Vampirovibrionales bacterium]|nr:shikimate kinase [Vampirovibrionales bacterium]